MGGTGGEGFVSACGGLHVKDGSYDVAVGEEDCDDAVPHNTTTQNSHCYFTGGCV